MKIVQIAVESAPAPGYQMTLYVLTDTGGIAFARDPAKATRPDDWTWLETPAGTDEAER